ncbi:hypothetical protein FRC09_014735 [Ceratobasidium sp. 395]|nr:hypothetical protein FRC09_014735 [Ceratobasidium sp. 395]
MSPSLRNLEFETNGPFETFRSLNVSEWPILLHHLAEKCPKLQTLSAFPRHFKNSLDPRVGLHISNDIKAKINSQRELGLGPFFANLCPLVSLTSSGEILDDACFSAIGTWPALESLTIRMNPKIRDCTIPTLDNTAFPALTGLTLHWIPNFNVFRMFWDTPALVSKLTTVKLLPSIELSYYTNEEISDTVSQILSMLAEKSPRLENIWLRMLHPDAGRPYNEIPRSILDVLHKLPLRSIHLDGVVLLDPETSGPKETHKNLDLVTYFAKMFPDLKQLGFPLHPVHLSIRRDFHSKFPQLESLCFDFDLSALSVDLKVDTANIPRYRSSPFFMLEANFLGISDESFVPSIKRFSYEDAMLFVTYVFSLWPDTQIAAQMEEVDCDGDRTVHHNMIELINVHLANLSWWNCDASVEYKDVKVLNEESWARCKVNNRGSQDGDSDSE